MQLASPTQGRLRLIDDKLLEAVHLAQAVVWEPNPELLQLLAHALDDVRDVVRHVDDIMAAQIKTG